jgi:proteasome lid subunit RPN8/RPN11
VISFAYSTIAEIYGTVIHAPAGQEVGGLFFGLDGGVLYAGACENAAADQHGQFAIAPAAQAAVIGMAADLGYELLGSFHTHPEGSAQMSRPDVATAEATGLLLIIATGDPRWEWKLFDPGAGGEVQFAISPPESP